MPPEAFPLGKQPVIARICTLDPPRDSTGLSSLYPWYNPLVNVILTTETTCSQYIYEPIDWWFTKDSSSETAIGRLASTFASFVTESATQETRGPKLSAGTTKAARTMFSPYPWCKPIVHCSNFVLAHCLQRSSSSLCFQDRDSCPDHAPSEHLSCRILYESRIRR